MKNSTTFRRLFLVITVQTTLFTAQAVHADYADLLEDCGGNTNYGLAASEQAVEADAEHIERNVVSSVVITRRYDTNNDQPYPSRYDSGEMLWLNEEDK